MKAQVLDLVRKGHLRYARKDLPSRLAIYFHELEKAQMPAFIDAMFHFQELGYRFADPRTYVYDDACDEKLLFVSFDDNFKNWYNALDVLEACGASCTFYVNSGLFRDVAAPREISDYFDRIRYFGERKTLSRPELREMADRGHTIGCHTHTHPMLSQTPRQNWYEEIVGSKRILEDIVGRPVLDFSFPFGMRRHFSNDLRDYCASVGFKTIVTGISGQLHANAVDPLTIHRTEWKFELDLEDNIANLEIDSRLYATLCGRSAVG